LLGVDTIRRVDRYREARCREDSIDRVQPAIELEPYKRDNVPFLQNVERPVSDIGATAEDRLVGRYSSSLEEVPAYTILLPNPKTGRAVLEPVERTMYLYNLALKCFQNATPLGRLLLSR
jgi:hypothetical protein